MNLKLGIKYKMACKSIRMPKLEDLMNEITELKGEVDEKVKDDKKNEATHKAALKAMEDDHKKAMDEKEHEKKAMDEDHKKEKEATYKSMKASLIASMNAEEDEKKKEGWKATLKAMEEEHMKESKYGKKADMDNPKEYEKKAEDKEKEREQTAQITYLSAEVIKPKIITLTQLYQASKTSDEKINEYKADWENQSGPQLDAEIEKMMNIVGKAPSTGTPSYEGQSSAFGFTTHKTKQFDANKLSDKIDKMTDAQLFTPGVN